jgi:hypothetical protein
VLLVTHIFPFITIAILRLRECALMEWQLLSCEIKLRGFREYVCAAFIGEANESS